MQHIYQASLLRNLGGQPGSMSPDILDWMFEEQYKARVWLQIPFKDISKPAKHKLLSHDYS